MKIHCRDIDIYYEEYGQGEPLILLHGNSQDSHYFSKQISTLSKKYRVITPDTRGHGKSSRGKQPLNFKVFAEDLRYFLDALGCKSVYLLGFSDGANIVLHFLLKYPDYVKKAILNSANLFPEGMSWLAKVYVGTGFIVTSLLSSLSKKMRHAHAPHWHRKKEIWALMHQHPRLTSKELNQIKIPVMILVGSRDIIRLAHTRDIARAIPNSKLVLIKGGTHFCAQQKPDIFNKYVCDYLTEEE